MFQNLALTSLADDVAQMNGYLATKEQAVLVSAHDVHGVLAAEQSSDALVYAKAAYKTLRGEAALAPLYPLLDDSLAVIEGTGIAPLRTHGYDTRVRLGRAETVEKLEALSKAQTFGAPISLVDSGFKPRKDRPQRMPVSRASVVNRAGERALAAIPSICALATTDGRVYSCTIAGRSYDSQFGASTGDPEEDVLRRANDGGYAQDNRRVSLEVEKVNDNLKLRIDDLTTRTSSAEQAFPSWTDANHKFTSETVTANEEETATVVGARVDLGVANADALASAAAEMDRFLAAPTDLARSAALTTAVGGADLSLPSVAADQIPPDAPALRGISAPERAYGSGDSATVNSIAQEKRKAASDISDSPELLTFVNRSLAVAGRFAGRPSELANKVAEELVTDAASVRFWKAGKVPKPVVTVVAEDGTLTQREVDDPTLTIPNSIVTKTEQFEVDRGAFQLREEALRAALKPPAADVGRRLEILESADVTADSATVAFYSGNINEGSRIVRFAAAMVDAATRWTPGVNWGRDVYEAIVGEDLFTGEKLSGFARTAAVLGVVSAGLSDEGTAIVRTISRLADLGEGAKQSEKILETAKSLDSMAVRMSEEAIRRKAERQIEQDLIDHALDRGTRFWDRDLGNLLSPEPGSVGVRDPTLRSSSRILKSHAPPA